MKKFFLLLSIIFLYGCPPQSTKAIYLPNLPAPVMKVAPKNIILMIGDGMGLTQISAGMYRNGNQLNLEKFPVIGLHKSYASNDLITDSAAGATAFACGVKTYNGAIGVNPDTVAVKTILEEAEEHGLKTGMVATSTIVHATPASFIAHQKQRKMYEEIAADFLKTDIDFFLGGGKKFFDRRDDGRNLYDELRAKDYIISDYFAEDLEDFKIDYSKKIGYLTSDQDPLPAAQGRDYLIPASEMAINYLDKVAVDTGFFLMIEGSQIDWGGHANNSDYIITEMIEFDNAIGKVLEFAEKDGETLVIITADHETGGYAINPGSTMDSIVPGFTSTYHTATMIPVFAYGPGSELFGGIYENTAIYHKMKAAFGF
ncbi:MAG: alkaline phosphatase [Saprospiraceae bacterium]|jgi:alkaline phosphatase